MNAFYKKKSIFHDIWKNACEQIAISGCRAHIIIFSVLYDGMVW